MLFQGRIIWWAALFGDFESLICFSFTRVRHCLRISTLFILCKIMGKLFLSTRLAHCMFCTMWLDEGHHQLLDKGALLIKDGQSLDPLAYFDFIYVIVSLQKWLCCSLYILFFLLLSL
jgi:hypothetical protein